MKSVLNALHAMKHECSARDWSVTLISCQHRLPEYDTVLVHAELQYSCSLLLHCIKHCRALFFSASSFSVTHILLISDLELSESCDPMQANKTHQAASIVLFIVTQFLFLEVNMGYYND